MTKNQINILDIIVNMTLKTKGQNAGETKGVVSGNSFDGRTVNSLLNQGFIEWKEETIYGSGYQATKLGYHIWKGLKK
jgi:hypothetical protein